MAYVGISQSLLSDVRRNIHRMKEQELNTLPHYETSISLTPMDKVQVEMYEKLLWGEHYALKDVIPMEWRTELHELRVTAVDEQQLAKIDIKFVPALMAPPTVNKYGTSLKVDKDWPGVAELFIAYEVRRECNARWDKIKADVGNFLQASKSLNSALKMWPDLRVYIPADYLSRIEVKVSRVVSNDAAEILKSIDTDTAVSSAITSRFIGAGSEA